jgi:hypothetical protein
MGGWTPIAPWKVIPGTGQSLAVSSGASSTFTNAVGSQTRCIQLSFAPTATAASSNCTVRISQAGTAATAVLDLLVKGTDPPVLVGCEPGDKVSAWGIVAGVLYLTEMSH